MKFEKERKSKSAPDQKLWHFSFLGDDVIGGILPEIGSA